MRAARNDLRVDVDRLRAGHVLRRHARATHDALIAECSDAWVRELYDHYLDFERVDRLLICDP
jgi:hypothetical protein